MNQKTFKAIVTILVIIILAGIIVYLLTKSKAPVQTDEEVIKCIAGESILYVQLGCHACEIQEDLFGENYKYINAIDCFYEVEKCQGIEATPTWEIKGEKYKGVQSIETLQELTGC